MKLYRDLREYIDLLDRLGELKRIQAEVAWDLELGAITRKVCNQRGPALLFENNQGYQDTLCRRLFTNGLGTKGRVNLALGLPAESPYKEIVRVMKERWSKPLDSLIVKDGAVKKHVILGDKVDLFQIPVSRSRRGMQRNTGRGSGLGFS